MTVFVICAAVGAVAGLLAPFYLVWLAVSRLLGALFGGGAPAPGSAPPLAGAVRVGRQVEPTDGSADPPWEAARRPPTPTPTDRSGADIAAGIALVKARSEAIAEERTANARADAKAWGDRMRAGATQASTSPSGAPGGAAPASSNAAPPPRQGAPTPTRRLTGRYYQVNQTNHLETSAGVLVAPDDARGGHELLRAMQPGDVVFHYNSQWKRTWAVSVIEPYALEDERLAGWIHRIRRLRPDGSIVCLPYFGAHLTLDDRPETNHLICFCRPLSTELHLPNAFPARMQYLGRLAPLPGDHEAALRLALRDDAARASR